MRSETVTEEQAWASAGEDIVYYGTKLRGASNQKAKKTFGFEPRRLEWLAGEQDADQHRRSPCP